MRSSYIALGYECNHNCIICPCSTYDRLHDNLGLEEIKQLILLTLDDANNAHIVLSGGEPTQYTYFLELLELLTEQGVSITVLSNAERFQNKPYVQKLKNIINPSRFNVVTAIHSPSAKIHDYITGVETSFYNSMQGLYNLVEYDINLTIKHIINGLTYKELHHYADFVSQSFPPQVKLEFTSIDYVGRAAKNFEVLAVKFHDVQPYLESALDLLETASRRSRIVRIIELPLCATDPYYWKYYPSPRQVLDLYVAPNVDNGRRWVEQVTSQCGPYYNECRECVVKAICPGAWISAYSKLENLVKTIKGV